MPLRQIDIPSLDRRLANLMAAPSSADPSSHWIGLDEYLRVGGNGLHLHAEGGETHSRQAVGQWLRRNKVTQSFFLLAQVCHDDWDEVNRQPINRFTPEALREDISAHLSLLGVECLDAVYLDDSPNSPLEPMIDALSQEIRDGRIRAFGVRNWSAARIKKSKSYAEQHHLPSVAAIVTTELSLPRALRPLWPEYIPFDHQMQSVVIEHGLAVFAHVGDNTIGQVVFDQERGSSPERPEWNGRWKHAANLKIASLVNSFAATRNLTSRELGIGYVLSQPFPVVGIIDLPSFLARPLEYVRASDFQMTGKETSTLTAERDA